MNWIQFGRLIRSIYSHNGKLPDLDWIQKRGLLAVKLGQVHALRSAFLEPAKCEHLSKLFRNNHSMGSEDFLNLVESTAVPEFISNFESIEPKALASASVGQVHIGILKDGNKVVIKAVKKGNMSTLNCAEEVFLAERLIKLQEQILEKRPLTRKTG